MQSIENKVISRIYGHKMGWVFTPNDFSDLGNTEAIYKALSRLVLTSRIRRLAKGVYDYPIRHPKLGDIAPPAEDIVKALVRKEHAKIQPSGAYAANLLGLSTQVPGRIIFLTDAQARTIKVGNRTIVLRRASTKVMATAGKVSGLIIQALKFIGRENLTDQQIDLLIRKLSMKERESLKKDVRYASPAWLARIIHQIADSRG